MCSSLGGKVAGCSENERLLLPLPLLLVAASLGEGTSRLGWNDTRLDLLQSYKFAYKGAGRTGRDLKRTVSPFSRVGEGRGVKRRKNQKKISES